MPVRLVLALSAFLVAVQVAPASGATSRTRSPRTTRGRLALPAGVAATFSGNAVLDGIRARRHSVRPR